MRFEGIHHVTCITGDAPGNVDFYTRVLGLRMVKKTVNQDDPTVYHLFYADEQGSPGADITFFEYPGARRGRAGAGHGPHDRVPRRRRTTRSTSGRPGSKRRGSRPDAATAGSGSTIPKGSGSSSSSSRRRTHRSCARHPEIPAEHALQGFDSVRAFAATPRRAATLLEATLGFVPTGEHTWEARGAVRGGHYAYDPPPASGRRHPRRGDGASRRLGLEHRRAGRLARDRARAPGAHPSGVIDRFWFRSIYFREPSGVLFEIATLGPGFTIDEDADHLGEALILPPAFEHLRAEIEPVLTPLPDPRAAWATS